MELIALHHGREEKIRIERAGHHYRVTVGETTYDVDVAHAAAGVYSLLQSSGQQHEVSVQPLADGRYQVASADGEAQVTLVDPLTHLAQQAHGAAGHGGHQQVTAYMPGRVVEVLVEEGDEVAAGQGVLVLEAMKMKNEIQAEGGGVISRILVETGQTVEGGDPLFEIE